MGVRAVEQLRLVVAGLMIADVRAQVMLSLAADFEGSRLRRRKGSSVLISVANVVR